MVRTLVIYILLWLISTSGVRSERYNMTDTVSTLVSFVFIYVTVNLYNQVICILPDLFS